MAAIPTHTRYVFRPFFSSYRSVASYMPQIRSFSECRCRYRYMSDFPFNSDKVWRCIQRGYSTNRKGYESASDKPHCNMGTIGHIDHGKTTLTAAITKVMEKQGRAKYLKYEQIDKTPEEQARGITINAVHVEYSTENRHYAHTDCPGHIDFIKNMIGGTSNMDGAIVVVAADDGTMPQTREHVLLAKQIGVEKVVVYINKADLADDDLLELVELEVRELLEEHGFDSVNTPVVCGSALCAINGTNPEIGEQSIIKLMEAVDKHIEIPSRDTEGPFYFPVNRVVAVKGRGTVIVGTLQRGEIKIGDKAQLIGFGTDHKTTITDIEVFNKQVQHAKAGDNVGVLLRGMKKEFAARGMFFCHPDSQTQTDQLKAAIYVRSKDEGGRTKPLTSGYRNQMFCDTWDQVCNIQLPENKEMVMPGEHCEVTVLLRKPAVIHSGVRFVVRENKMTAITGRITEVLPQTEQKILGFNVLKKARVTWDTSSRQVQAKLKRKLAKTAKSD